MWEECGVRPAKMAKLIEVPFGVVSWVGRGPRNHVLDERSYWRHLANTIG